MKLNGVRLVFVLLLSITMTTKGQCLPHFHYRTGWLGADAAYSVPLQKQRTLWLFGDTFINKRAPRVRIGSTMIANSVGISHCLRYHFKMHYYWRSVNGKPAAFFKSDSPSIFWPRAGISVDSKAYVFLFRVKRTAQPPLPFEIQGVDFATISDTNKSPLTWSINLQKSNQGNQVLPGAAVVKKQGYLYFFSNLQGEKYQGFPVILQRVSINNLHHLFKSIQTLNQSGQWVSGLHLNHAKIIVPSAATEMSVHYDKDIQRWVMIYSDLPQPGSDKIVMRQAPSLIGPWTPEQVIYHYPEMWPGRAKQSPGVFCYAAKAHPNFKLPNHKIVITYACNSTQATTLFHQLNIYRPRVISLSVPLIHPLSLQRHSKQ